MYYYDILSPCLNVYLTLYFTLFILIRFILFRYWKTLNDLHSTLFILVPYNINYGRNRELTLHSTLFILVPVSAQSYRYLSITFLFCLPLFFTAIIFLIHFYLSLLLHFFLYFLSLSFSYDIFIITGRQLQKSARFIILHANKFLFQPPFIT